MYDSELRDYPYIIETVNSQREKMEGERVVVTNFLMVSANTF